MEVEVRSAIHKVFLGAWNRRSPVQEWAHEIQKIMPEDAVALLCDHFISVSKEGNIFNKLLYNYLEYALAHGIISFQEFFQSLWQAIQSGDRLLLSSTKFPMFIQIIEKFLPSFRFPVGTTLEDGPMRFILIVARILTEAIYASISELSNDPSSKSTEGILGNIHKCLRILSEAPKSERFRGYLLIAKNIHEDLWEEFTDKVQELHEFFREPKSKKLTKLQPLWIQYCQSHSLVTQPMYHASNTLWKRMPVSSMHKNAEKTGNTSPWNALMFAIQFEICSRRLHVRRDSTKRVLESFRRTHQWKASDFYVYLFVAALKTEWQLYRRQMNSMKQRDADWAKSRWFLLVKLPLMIMEWEQAEPKPFFYQRKSELNNVELALVHLFDFPALYQRVKDNSIVFELYYQLVYACEDRGMISLAILKEHLEGKEIPPPVPRDDTDDLTLESIRSSGMLALRGADVNVLESLLMNEISRAEGSDMEDVSSLDILLRCLVHSLEKAEGRQELLVDLVIRLVSGDNYENPSALCVTGRIFEKLASNPDILQLFYLHEQIVAFISSVAFFCEESGKQIQIGNQPAAIVFSPVFFLLVRIIDKFGIKEGSFNQFVFIDIVDSFPLTKEWYSRYSHSFFCEDIPASYSSAHVQQCGAFLHSGPQAALTFVQSSQPWQILLCLPIFLRNGPTEQTKAQYHQTLVALCRAFYPATISLNEFYDPVVSAISVVGQQPSMLSLIEELHDGHFPIPPEATSVLHALQSNAKRDRSQGITSESEEVQFVPEIKGPTSYTDFLANVKLETNTLFTALLGGSFCLSHKMFSTFYLLLCRIGKREFVSTMLKEAIILAPSTTVGYDAAYAMRAAELGGSIVGLCGAEVVAEFITQSLPLFVPVITSEKQAQMVAHFTWSACRLSQIFHVEESEIERGLYSNLVAASRLHCMLFFTELLERQCRAPSPVLALPVYFFLLLSSEKHILQKFGSVARVVEALRKLHCVPLCATLFDFKEGKSAFEFYNSLL